MVTAPSPETMTQRQRSAAASRERTRLALLEAADVLFTTDGYVATSVTAVAARAGVTVQTLYLAWGSKSALFRACALRALSGGSAPFTDDVWRERIRVEVRDRMLGSDSAVALVVALADAIVSLADRAGRYWSVYQEAAVVDHEVDADWQALTRLRRGTFRAVMDDFPVDRLRAGLTLDQAADTLWAIASPEMHRFLTRAAMPDVDFGQWLRTTMVSAIVADTRCITDERGP